MAEPKHVRDARMKVARLYNGRVPTQSEEASTRADYVTCKIDADIRKTVQKSLNGARLDDNHAAHLCGLVLSLTGVPGDTAEQFEQVVRAAVLEAQQGGER